MSSFMCQKSFHPASKANQKARWIAEQREEKKQKLVEQRRKQLEIEEKQLLEGGKQSELNFMYKPPPGYIKSIENKKQEDIAPKPNDDLPHLQNAPTEGEYTKDIEVTHKPFGLETRKVRCLRCGTRGHHSKDKACPMYNKIIDDNGQKEIDDPLQIMNQSSDTQYSHGNLIMKETLSELHHGPASLRGKYDLVGSDDEIDINAEELVEQLTKKQRKRLIKYMKKQKKKQKKDKKKRKSVEEDIWVESSNTTGTKRKYMYEREEREYKHRKLDSFPDYKRKSSSYHNNSDKSTRYSRDDRSYHSNSSNDNKYYKERDH